MFKVKFTQRFIIVPHSLRINSCTNVLKTLNNKSAQCAAKEIEIPVPWGKVAGTCGSSTRPLCILQLVTVRARNNYKYYFRQIMGIGR